MRSGPEWRMVMRKYLKCFISETNAVETIEWIAILSVAAALIIIAAKCGNAIRNKLSVAISYI